MSAKDPGIHSEPHLRQDAAWRGPRADPSETKVHGLAREFRDDHDQIDDSVFDEPWMGDVPGAGREVETYAGWLRTRLSRQTLPNSILWMFLLVAAAGPFAIIAALYEPLGVGGFGFGVILLYLVIGPTTEEVAKVALLFWTIERRPYRLLHGSQVLLVAAAGGLVFAVIENLMYLLLYLEDPSPLLVLWRWVICTFLHVFCSLLVGLGLLKLWQATRTARRRPDAVVVYPFLLGAIVAHGLYNAFAILVGMTGLLD